MQTVKVQGRTCERSCSFYVAAVSDKGEHFYVMDWMPEYKISYHAATGFVAQDPAFSCCPTTAEDCCAFQDSGSSLFCDQFGQLRPECPAGRWPCYFPDLEKYLGGTGVPANVLHVGDSRGAQRPLAAGVALAFFGLLSLTCLRPGMYTAPCRSCIKLIPVPRNAYMELAKALPLALRTKRMIAAIEDAAARTIQHKWREWHYQTNFREVVTQACEKQKTKHFFVPKLVTRDMLYGPKSGKVPAQNLLYDTGDASTFRRVVHARTVDSPTPGKQRIEVSMTNAAWLIDLLRVGTDHLGRELAPQICSPPPRAFADVYGIRQGHCLIRVGRLEWPAHSGSTLLKAMSTSRRPVMLLFEGAAPNMEPIRRSAPPPNMLVPPPYWMEAPRQRNKASDGRASAPPSKSLAALAETGADPNAWLDRQEAEQHVSAWLSGPQDSGCGSASDTDHDLEHGTLLPGQTSAAGSQVTSPTSSRISAVGSLASPTSSRKSTKPRKRSLQLPSFARTDSCLEDATPPGSPSSICSSPTGRRGRRTAAALKDFATRRATSVGGSPTGGRRKTTGWTSGRFSPLKGRHRDATSNAGSAPASPSSAAGGGSRRRRHSASHSVASGASRSEGEPVILGLRSSARAASASGREGQPLIDE
mmetsp:Transcript_38619/g.103013  ORF Transcript_38619/g.103013 Transcript_38619/m.103013 type:complete len:644 (+) Transcript_38619:3-1934(+)